VIFVCAEDFVRAHPALNHFISHLRHYSLANDDRAGKFAKPDNPRRDNREYSFILEFHIGLRIIYLAISNNKLGFKKQKYVTPKICNLIVQSSKYKNKTVNNVSACVLRSKVGEAPIELGPLEEPFSVLDIEFPNRHVYLIFVLRYTEQRPKPKIHVARQVTSQRRTPPQHWIAQECAKQYISNGSGKGKGKT
jgi:hypothetical protein